MNNAWMELKHFPQLSPGHVVRAAFLIWLCAEHNRLLRILQLRPSHTGKEERETAIWARAVADRTRAVDPLIRVNEGITDVTLVELDRVATFFKQENKIYDDVLKIAPPPRKAKAGNALQIAFVNAMCTWLWQKNKRRPYILVAVLTNVVFNVSGWDADRVKKCYRSRSPAVKS
jgi:hypothetical protein